MNTYKNKETGAIVLTDSELSGAWELVEAPKKAKNAKKEVADADE